MPQDRAPWECPFIVQGRAGEGERHGAWDLYDPVTQQPRPAVVFVHGGPVSADLPVKPRDWPVFKGYGALAAGAGVVGVTVDHPLHDMSDYASAYAVVLGAIEEARDDPRVDGDRVGVWVFSGGGPLLSPLLRETPPWLRCLAATYPVLDSRPDRELPAGFRPADELSGATSLPLVLTRVGLEAPLIAQGVASFLAYACTSALQVDVIDVPDGYHGFDLDDATPASVSAVEQAMERVTAALRK